MISILSVKKLKLMENGHLASMSTYVCGYKTPGQPNEPKDSLFFLLQTAEIPQSQ